MRKLFVLFVSGLLALGLAGSASAAVLNWEGTFTLDMADFGEGNCYGGGVATINGSAGLIPGHLSTLRLAGSRGHVTGSFTNFVTDPENVGNGIAAIRWQGVEGGTGTLVGISGGAASTSTGNVGPMPIQGVVKLCLLSTVCTTYLSLPFTQPTTVNGVPGTGIKGLGIGGTGTIGGYGGIRFSLYWGPWTIKTLTVVDHITTVNGANAFTDIVQKGWVHGAGSNTTSTAQPSGMVQLVTPNQVETNLALGTSEKVGSSALLVLHFIPEPGLLLLVGSAVVGLALLGRRRMRR